MKRYLNIIFALHLIFFALIVIGILPRTTIIYETVLVVIYLLFASLEDGLVFFVRSIPLFIAIPLTVTFDNFNQWRIFSIVLFLRFLFVNYKEILKIKWLDYKKSKLTFTLLILLGLAVLSLIPAADKFDAIKRIIYFVNASLVGIMIWFYTKDKEYTARLVKNIAIPTIIVTVVGVLQLASTYLIDIYQFMRVWGEGVQLRQFGTQWSYIATHVGNTWFAYYGDQLSLRIFSLFPDSHSFPIFLLLGLPAVLAISIIKPVSATSLKNKFHTRGSLKVLWVPLIFLMLILTGTRGIWLAGAGAIIWSLLIWCLMILYKKNHDKRNIFIYIASYLSIFLLLFSVAYPILSSPQFLVSKSDALLLEHRLRSVLDFGETSNAARIAIWKSSAQSILHHPFLGVGIGNFPVVLGQNILLSKAGSSAHNIYIHMAAEMGIFAFLATLYLVWLIIRKLYLNYLSATSPFENIYTAALLITVPWVLAYLMTDVALFDERALLLFGVTLGLIFRE